MSRPTRKIGLEPFRAIYETKVVKRYRRNGSERKRRIFVPGAKGF